MKRVGLVLDPVFEEHDPGAGFPERPDRLRRVRRFLQESGVAGQCTTVPTVAATDEQLTRVHTAEYVERVEEACRSGQRFLDSQDVVIGTESARVARLAAGSLVALVDRVMDGELDRGLALVRPPGHHAERDLAMGFCLFNNVAVAAEHLVAERGLERVLIVDWDVHHGNGTQHHFEERGDVLFFSSHQYPLYPGTGTADETGRGDGAGATLNCPLPPGTVDEGFLAALEGPLTDAADRFRPQFVLVSAGFDAHRQDPLAQLEVSTEAFGRATRIVAAIADRHAGGRLVATLEGGYDLEALAASTAAHLQELLE